MTTNTPLDPVAKPAAKVIALDDFRDPNAVLASTLRRNADAFLEMAATFRPTAIAPEPWVPTAEQQAEIAASAARLRDPSTWLADLRAAFSPIATAIASMASAAAEIEAALKADQTLSAEQLAAAVSILSAILNHDDMAGASLYDAASEALQYAALLNGDYVIDAVGDVVYAKPQAAS